jgi:hypothetical protein
VAQVLAETGSVPVAEIGLLYITAYICQSLTMLAHLQKGKTNLYESSSRIFSG